MEHKTEHTPVPDPKGLPFTKLIVWGAILILALIVLSNSIVYVYEDRYVCVKRFNRVVAIHDEPGLAFKVPFLDVAQEIPKNAIIYDLQPSDVLTKDTKAMTVSSYAIWRIVDPLKFLQNAENTYNAERRLDALTYNAVKNLISSMDQLDVISTRGQELDRNIASNVREQMLSNYGIYVVDIKIKQFDLPQDNKDAVYTRMISDRAQLAARYNAQGRSEADIIKNTADREVVVLVSQARSKSEQLRGEGEREYMRILAEAYNTPERAEFYEFVRSMDALKASLRGETTVIMPMDTPLMRWLAEK